MATTLVRLVRSSATLDTPPCANRHHTRRSLLVVAVPTPQIKRTATLGSMRVLTWCQENVRVRKRSSPNPSRVEGPQEMLRQLLGQESLRTASGSSITHVMSVTYIFRNCARPPISSAVLNRLSRALRGRDRMAIACAPVLPAPSAAFRAAIAGAPEAPVGRDPGGFVPFRGRGRPRGGSWRLSEPTFQRWVTHRTPRSSAELPSTFSFGGAEDRGSKAAQPTRPDPPATRGRPRA